MPAQVASKAKQPRLDPDFSWGWIRVKKCSSPPTHSLCPTTGEEKAQGKGGGDEGGRASAWLPSPPRGRAQSVPTARDVAPPFGMVPIRSTPRLEVWLSSLSPQLRIPCLCHFPGPSAPPCCTAGGLSGTLVRGGGEIWGRPLSRLRVGGMCKLSGWPSGSWVWRHKERTEPAPKAAKRFVCSIRDWDRTPGGTTSLRRRQGPGLRRGRKDRREKGLTPREVGCEASLRSLPGSAILQLLEAWQTSGSPTGGLPASWPRWLLHTQQPTPVLVALASSSFFIWVWRELSGPPSPAWAPSSLTHSGRLETSWLSPLRASWQSLALPREGRAQKPPSGAGLGQGAAPAGRREAPGRAESEGEPGGRQGTHRGSRGGGKLLRLPPRRVSHERPGEPRPAAALRAKVKPWRRTRM